jgi:hypothetical protein
MQTDNEWTESTNARYQKADSAHLQQEIEQTKDKGNISSIPNTPGVRQKTLPCLKKQRYIQKRKKSNDYLDADALLAIDRHAGHHILGDQCILLAARDEDAAVAVRRDHDLE